MFGTDAGGYRDEERAGAKGDAAEYFMFCAGDELGVYRESPDVYTSILDGSPRQRGGVAEQEYSPLK